MSELASPSLSSLSDQLSDLLSEAERLLAEEFPGVTADVLLVKSGHVLQMSRQGTLLVQEGAPPSCRPLQNCSRILRCEAAAHLVELRGALVNADGAMRVTVKTAIQNVTDFIASPRGDDR